MRLSVSCEAATHRVTNVVVLMFFAKFPREFRPLGPRTDKAHLPAKDIPQLRKLVKTGAAQESADACAAGIARDRPNRTEVAFGFFMHRPKFDERESPAAESHAPLPIEDRTSIAETHSQGDHGEQWRERD